MTTIKAWLVECFKRDTTYWLGLTKTNSGSYVKVWTTDANHAVHFVRKEDAIKFGHTMGDSFIVTEHVFYGEKHKC